MTSSEPTPAERRPQRRRTAAAAGAGVAVLAVVALWLARGPIAESLARDWLRRHGVHADLDIRSLSLTGLSARVRLGDARDPVLSVEHLEVGYALTGPWSGAPLGVETRSLRLVRPHLRLRVGPRGLDFGPLQRLVDGLTKGPRGKAPPLDVVVEDGVVELSTTAGDVAFHGGAQLAAGRLQTLSGALAPLSLHQGGARISVGGGGLHVERRGDRLILSADLGPIDAAAQGAAKAHVARAQLHGAAPYPPASGAWLGPVQLSLTALGVSSGGRAANGQGVVNADLDGSARLTGDGQAFDGRMLVSASFPSFATPGARLSAAAMELSLPHLALKREGGVVSAAGEGAAEATGAGATPRGGQFAVTGGATRVRAFALQIAGGRITGSASLDGSLAGHGATPPALAADIARRTPILSSEPAYRAAIAKAVRAFDIDVPAWRGDISPAGVRLSFPTPARIQAKSGARVALAGGAFTIGARSTGGAGTLTADGGGLPALRAQITNASWSAAGYRADLAAQGDLDAFIARGASVQLKGRLSGSNGGVRFELAACVPERARRVALDPNPVTDFTATLCPADKPLFAGGPAGWTMAGRFEDARGAIPSVQAKAAGAAGAFTAAGRGDLDAANIALDRSELADAGADRRFQPLGLSGRVGLVAGAWTGVIGARTAASRPIGEVRFRHDAASGAGRADIETGTLAFAPGGLQPAEISPLFEILRHADGAAVFQGWMSWRAHGQGASGGHLTVTDLKFSSPAGAVSGASADVAFTSLIPLVTAPHQTISISQVQSPVPVSGLSVAFDLGADRIVIDSASGEVAQGRVRLSPTVAPLTGHPEIKGELVLDHVDMGRIIGASSLADTIKLDAVVDGRIPFVVGASGLKITDGRLAATGPGRLTISRKALGGLQGAGASSSIAQDLAYQAMEDLAFDQLDATLQSQPQDRLGVLFHIKGRHAPPTPQRATIGLGSLLRGKPLEKPLTLPSDTKIDLTLDTSLNFGELVRSIEQAWRQSLAPAAGSATVHAAGGSMNNGRNTEHP